MSFIYVSMMSSNCLGRCNWWKLAPLKPTRIILSIWTYVKRKSGTVRVDLPFIFHKNVLKSTSMNKCWRVSVICGMKLPYFLVAEMEMCMMVLRCQFWCLALQLTLSNQRNRETYFILLPQDVSHLLNYKSKFVCLFFVGHSEKWCKMPLLSYSGSDNESDITPVLSVWPADSLHQALVSVCIWTFLLDQVWSQRCVHKQYIIIEFR